MTETKNLLTIDETAQYLSCTPTTVRRMLRRGDLRGVKFGKFWRVPREVLRRREAEALNQPATINTSTENAAAEIDVLLDATGQAARSAGYRTDEDIERLISEVRAESGHDAPRRTLRKVRLTSPTPRGANA